MNNVVLMGRLTRDPEVRYSQTNQGEVVNARYTLAVNRRFQREGEANADFINCVAFGNNAKFAEKYFRQGLKIVVRGHIQTGSYVNRDGQRVYTTDVIIDEQNFAESKASQQQAQNNKPQPEPENASNFMDIPNEIDAELPFN